MRVVRVFLFLALGLALLAPLVASAEESRDVGRTTMTAIQDAASSGRITQSEALLYKVYAIFSPEKLPQEFRIEGSKPVRCGTSTLLEIKNQLSILPEGTRQEVERFFARPNLDSYIDTPHFRVHYSTGGTNIIRGWPNPAFRDSVVASCERGYNDFVALNFPAPPSDGAMGGNGKIDCYCDALGSGVMGVTFPETPLGSPYPNTYTAYFIIDHDFGQYGGDPWDNMRVTVVHEYMHVVQMGLNALTSSWWMENCATWSEEICYDQSNQYVGYLRSYFGRPWVGLRTADGQWEYACMIWPTYLSERWSVPIVKDVWMYDAVNTNLVNAFNNVLNTYQPDWPVTTAWDLAVNEWARWNLFTCDRADDRHYSEGSLWRDPACITANFDNDINTFPVTDRHPSTAKMPQALGTNFTRIRPQTGSTDNKITIDFTGLNACEANHYLLFIRKLTGNPVIEEYVVPIDASNHGRFELTQWDQSEYMFMGVELKRACGSSGKDFMFSAATSYVNDVADGIAPTRIIRLDQNAPNPFNPRTTIKYATSSLSPVRLEIFDAAGRHVRTLINETQPAGEHQAKWYGEDESGRQMPAGLYLYSIKCGNEQETRKMLMVE